MANKNRPITDKFRKALVVDDNAEYAELLHIALARLGYRPMQAATLTRARELLRDSTPQLVLLDAHLPDGSGLELCRDIRKETRLARALVIVLSAKKNVWRGQEWLAAEADQCWPKIHDVDRLCALLKALLRRVEWDTKSTMPGIPGLLIDRTTKTIVFKGEVSGKFSDREFAFLNMLFSSFPDTLSRTAVHEQIFSFSRAEQFDLALNEFVRRLRKKLPPSLSDRVEAVYGHGYRLDISTDAITR